MTSKQHNKGSTAAISNKDDSILHERDNLQLEHLNIKVTDNNNKIVFKVK